MLDYYITPQNEIEANFLKRLRSQGRRHDFHMVKNYANNLMKKQLNKVIKVV